MLTPRYAWTIRTEDRTPAHVDEVIPLLLELRGVTPEEHRVFLTPVYEEHLHDPAALPDFPAALERVLRAREREEAVAVFGDYDVDGVTASAILQETFKTFGIRARVMLPHREQDGYGLSVDAARELVPPATLLITVDNGTSAHEAVAEARQRGADVLILDHHSVQDRLPDGALVVNPARPDHTYPFSRLSAAGMAFKLAHALWERLGRGGGEKWLLDLVALGTLADRVPLVGENRSLVQWGIRVLREQHRVGLLALATHARVHLPSCDADDVTFRLVPRLNAAGRMQHADLALRLLTTDDPQEAAVLAETLEGVNRERKTLTDRLVRDIKEHLTRSVPLSDILCVSGRWPVGVLGVLAGRIAEDIGRPAVVISVGDTECVSSARGNGTINVVDVVRELAGVLTKFGGHAGAAGFSFPRELLPEVERFFATFTVSDRSQTRTSLDIDCRLPLELMTKDLARHLQILEPHGEGNARPLFLLEGLMVEDVRTLGATGDHHRFQFSHAGVLEGVLSAVAFRWGDRSLPARGDRVDVAAEVRLDRFQGRDRLDLTVRDLQTHRAAVEVPSGTVKTSSLRVP